MICKKEVLPCEAAAKADKHLTWATHEVAHVTARLDIPVRLQPMNPADNRVFGQVTGIPGNKSRCFASRTSLFPESASVKMTFRGVKRE